MWERAKQYDVTGLPWQLNIYAKFLDEYELLYRRSRIDGRIVVTVCSDFELLLVTGALINKQIGELKIAPH